MPGSILLHNLLRKDSMTSGVCRLMTVIQMQDYLCAWKSLMDRTIRTGSSFPL